MNRRQRDKNRRTARWLEWQKLCPRCGQRGRHYYGPVLSLEQILNGVESVGIWTCGSGSTLTNSSSERPAPLPAKAHVLFQDNLET